MAVIHLGLGSNLGDRRAHLGDALRRLSGFIKIEAVSSVYQTAPVGVPDQPDFWNLVVRARTELGAETLLGRIHEVEQRLGRERPFPGAPRTIDIDLLLYDDLIMATPMLEVPHPRLPERAFVLRPLAEIDPDLRHPATGQTMAELNGLIGEAGRIVRLFAGTDLLVDHA
jgi:2-amino-4-hydroxy-6-hydroxymethyldihydropteridine diphosphokinase